MNNNPTVTQAEALDSFVEHIEEAKTRAAEITKALEEFLNWTPDEINWSHTGTIKHLADELDHIQWTIENASPSTKQFFSMDVEGTY